MMVLVTYRNNMNQQAKYEPIYHCPICERDEVFEYFEAEPEFLQFNPVYQCTCCERHQIDPAEIDYV
jgi:hypothetical protein